jgi:ParB/RepB/Spo0J family partition protein
MRDLSTEKDVLRLDPSHVKVGWRVRAARGDLKQIIDSVSDTGQIHPIAVREIEKGRYELVAGMRRLQACKALKVNVLATVITPEDEGHQLDVQLQENLARQDFDPLEVAEGLARRKEIYEREHPETAIGATGRGRPKADSLSKSDKPPAERFRAVAAKKLGVGETKIEELLQLSSLPKSEKQQICQFPARERLKAVREALHKVRVGKKKKQLQERAQERAKKSAGDTPSADVGRVVLRLENNRKFFATTAPGSFDLILTDPPYESGRQSLISHARRGSIKTDFGAWDKLDVGWVVKAEPILARAGQILAFCPLEAIGDYKTVMEGLGLTWHGAIVWTKSNPGTVHRPTYLSACEAIVWATKGAGYHFVPWDNSGAAEVRNVIEGPICGGNERLDHPTQKPLWLLERFLKRHACEHTRVLDPFCGVGSTLVACKRLGMHAVGVEKDPGYVGSAKLRLEAER